MSVSLVSSNSSSAAQYIAHFKVEKTKFSITEIRAFERYDVVTFNSDDQNSLFTYVCIDFARSELAVNSIKKFCLPFRDFFMDRGMNGDKLSVGYYSTTAPKDVQKLASLLLENILFPKEWTSFFETLSKDGTWSFKSKKEGPIKV